MYVHIMLGKYISNIKFLSYFKIKLIDQKTLLYSYVFYNLDYRKRVPYTHFGHEY